MGSLCKSPVRPLPRLDSGLGRAAGSTPQVPFVIVVLCSVRCTLCSAQCRVRPHPVIVPGAIVVEGQEVQRKWRVGERNTPHRPLIYAACARLSRCTAARLRLGLGDAFCYTAGRYTVCGVLYLVHVYVCCVCFLCLSMPGIAARPVCMALCLWVCGCVSVTCMDPAGAYV